MTDTVNDVFRSGALSAVIPPAPASATAQSDNTGGPLNIRHIKRGHAFASLTGVTGDLTFSESSWADLHPQLVVSIATSERPILMQANFMYARGSTTDIAFSFSINNQEVTGATNGLSYPYVVGSVVPLSIMWVAEPGPGTHRIAVVGQVIVGTSGTIYCANDVAVLAVREI